MARGLLSPHPHAPVRPEVAQNLAAQEGRPLRRPAGAERARKRRLSEGLDWHNTWSVLESVQGSSFSAVWALVPGGDGDPGMAQ